MSNFRSLSRPSLSIQHPLPTPSPSPKDSPSIFPSQSTSLAFPSSIADSFVLSPLLTLPPAFGSAYVGETFSCTLCANNELLPDSPVPKNVNNVRIDAEMKVPSSTTAIPLILGPDATSPTSPEDQAGEGEEPQHKAGVDLAPGESLQKIVSFELKEEGSHVLAVTVTYSETTPTSGRVRTFRKLYQFVCKGCMIVRTKAGLLPPLPLEAENGGVKRGRRWALEAQLENTGEETITLDMVILEAKEGFKSRGINWEVVREGEDLEKPVLMPGDVQQVCFIIEEILDEEGKGQEAVDGRIHFGILSMGWRGPMGNRGYLSTGSLGARV